MTPFEKHKAVIEKHKDVLMEAEKIKTSKEYLNAMHYFNVQKNRGNIETFPCVENGFSIVKTEKRAMNEQKNYSFT